MSRYKVDICGVNTADLVVLKNSEMMELFKAMKAGDKSAKEKLVNGNLKLVLSMVQRFSYRNENMDDLFQIGCVGLIKAVDNFDLKHEVRFSTYAVPMILGEIKRYLRDNQSMRVSRHLKDVAYRSLRFKEEYQSEHQKEPTIAEIAAHLEVKEKEVVEALEAIQSMVSIFEPVYNNNGDSLLVMDQIKDTHDEIGKLMNILSLRKGLKSLNDKELLVINERFYNGKTQIEIAKDLHVSQAQISRLEKSALEELKKFF